MTDWGEDSQVEDTLEAEVFPEEEEDSPVEEDTPEEEVALLEQDPQEVDGDPHQFKHCKSTKENW